MKELLTYTVGRLVEDLKNAIVLGIQITLVLALLFYTKDYWIEPTIEILKAIIKWLGGETC